MSPAVIGSPVATNEEEVKQIWKDYQYKLLNEEFEWDKDSLEWNHAVIGPIQEISEAEVKASLDQMKSGKAADPSGVVSEMLKAAGDAGVRGLTSLFKKILSERKVPIDWTRSWITSVYKGKGDALECSSYRGIKLLEHAMKVFERVIERRLRITIQIDEMQFRFRPRRGTTDAIFVVRQLQEKYMEKKKDLWMAFVDLEKAFDRVPREVLWWALRKMNVPEQLLEVIKAMYSHAKKQ